MFYVSLKIVLDTLFSLTYFNVHYFVCEQDLQTCLCRPPQADRQSPCEADHLVLYLCYHNLPCLISFMHVQAVDSEEMHHPII